MRSLRNAVLLAVTTAVVVGATSACGSFGTAPSSSHGDPATDAAVAPEAAPDGGSFCATSGRVRADHCFDFDESDDVAAGWSEVVRDPGSKIALGKARVVSAPSSMVSSTRIASDRARMILKGVVQASSRLVVELDIFPETTGQSAAQAIAFDQGPRALIVYVTPDSVVLEEWNDEAGVQRQAPPAPFAANAWHHMLLELADGTGTLSVDGAEVARESLSEGWTDAPVDVSVGIGYGAGNDGPWSFVYDNVLIGVR